jgi:hypothetical protein
MVVTAPRQAFLVLVLLMQVVAEVARVKNLQELIAQPERVVRVAVVMAL